MSVNYAELGEKLASAVRESPGYGETDPKIRDQYRATNAARIWQLWTQMQLFDPRDHHLEFSRYSGLPSGVVSAYLNVCRQYQQDRAVTRKAAKKVGRTPN